MYLVSSGSKYSFNHCKHFLRLWDSLLCAVTKSELKFLLRADFFFPPQATEIHMSTQIGLKITLLLVGLEYLVVQM